MTIVAYRHAGYDTPWWANPNSAAGRFHRANEATTQYLCTHPLGPAAEMLRHNLGPVGAGDADTVRLNLWAARIETEGLSTVDFDDCATHNITPDELVGDDYAPTQELADTLRDYGATGIVFPSAALPGTYNVALFGPRMLHPYLWEPVVPEEVPTGHVSDGATAPAEVAPIVRWFGAAHTALAEWKATGTYTLLDDPQATRW